jgi:nucleoside-diphosphate-sugar epimerase
MRIFLAGASGVIGRPLVRDLVAAGHTVAGTTRHPANADALRALGAEPVVVDIYDRDRVAAVVRAAQPDAVIHQLTDLRQMDLAATARVRLEGTRNLVDAARAAGVRRIVTQSIAFVYVPGAGLATEDEPLYVDAPAPWDSAPRSTAGMEQMVDELPESVVLRYGLLYGPGTAFAADGVTAAQVRRGEQPANENVASFLHVDDAVTTARLALDWPPSIYNVVDDEPVAATTWLPLYAAALGGPPPATVAGRDPLMSRGASNAKARQACHWTPRHPTWRDSLLGAREHPVGAH